MSVKLKDSIGFKFAAALVVSIILLSIISMNVVYFQAKDNLEDKIVNRGKSMMNNYIKNSHDSIAKGQRKTFQRVMDAMADVEGVGETMLYARSGLLTYLSGHKTVGKPFLQRKGEPLKNPNIELYEKTNGAYLRSDYSSKDQHESKKVQPHLRKIHASSQSCTDCHIHVEQDLKFENSMAVKLGDEISSFYYNIPVERDCISCHTNWKEGESSGILELTIEHKKDVEDVNNEMYKIGMMLVTIGVTISIIAILLARRIVKYLDRLKSGIEDLINSEGSKIVIDTKDEISQIADQFNNYISKIEEGSRVDARVIEDAKEVTGRVSQGYFDAKITQNTQNNSLNELKEIINGMIDRLNHAIGADVNAIKNVLEEYQKLNFTAKVPNAKGEIERSINSLTDDVSKMLAESKSNGLALDRSSDLLLENVNELNKNSNEAAAFIEETAASLEEITENISTTTTNIIKMSQFASELSGSANHGLELASNTTTAMDEINSEVISINEAIGVIDQIAFQTNILSLNAAVESATAGEAGKGFAVVAGEVRNLASRSSDAANEIKKLVDNAINKADYGKDIASKMISGYNGLNENIAKTTEIISDIETASKEQLRGIEQINTAINSLDRQTQQNASIASHAHDIAIETDTIAKLVVSNADEKEFIGKNAVIAKDIKSHH